VPILGHKVLHAVDVAVVVLKKTGIGRIFRLPGDGHPHLTVLAEKLNIQAMVS